MSAGRLLTLATIAGLLWLYQDLAVRAVGFLRHLVPLASTYMEMESFRGRLGEYARAHDGELPRDIGPWLNANFSKPGKPDLGIDEFGGPYQTDWDRERARGCLRSAGPDGEHGNDDDLVMRP